jgi:inhibitor of cysteine peptidase
MAVIELGIADAGRVVEALPGDEVVVRLDEAPTSGYRWEPDPGPPPSPQPQSDEYAPPAAGLGGTGIRSFRFLVGGPGTTTIRLVHRRAWEPAIQATGSFEVTVRAE